MTDQTFGQGSEAGLDQRPTGAGSASTDRGSEAVRRDGRSGELDSERIGEAVGERASELERWIVTEMRDRPWHALGWAAAVGLFFGVLAAR